MLPFPCCEQAQRRADLPIVNSTYPSPVEVYAQGREHLPPRDVPARRGRRGGPDVPTTCRCGCRFARVRLPLVELNRDVLLDPAGPAQPRRAVCDSSSLGRPAPPDAQRESIVGRQRGTEPKRDGWRRRFARPPQRPDSQSLMRLIQPARRGKAHRRSRLRQKALP